VVPVSPCHSRLAPRAQTEALLELLASAEALGAAGDECGLCDEKTVAAQEDEDARVTEGADRFTAYVKHDTRFELQWVRCVM